MERPVTMQQIADKAGVSRMTVSRVLRNEPYVTEATARRVRIWAESLGYCPDPMIQRLTSHLARSQRRNKGQVIAWINSHKDHKPWHGQIPFVSTFRGAEAQAKKLGFKLEEFWLGELGMTGKKLSRILYQRGIECLILAPTPKGAGHLTMDWGKFSSVAIGYAMVFPKLHRVGGHYLHAAREAIRHLYRRGHRRIGLCMARDANLRLDHSWLEALAYYQLRTPKRNWIKPLIQTKESAQEMLGWIARERPDSILSHYEWLPEILRDAHYRIPEDLAVALFNVENAPPGTAGIDQRNHFIGETACDLVVGQHYRNEKGIPALPYTIMIEGCWVDGQTVARKSLKA